MRASLDSGAAREWVDHDLAWGKKSPSWDSAVIMGILRLKNSRTSLDCTKISLQTSFTISRLHNPFHQPQTRGVCTLTCRFHSLANTLVSSTVKAASQTFQNASKEVGRLVCCIRPPNRDFTRFSNPSIAFTCLPRQITAIGAFLA